MRRKRESGFALLLVFAMAGAIAIMLYSQMPRVAFEAQRDKEALLQERGEQYVRGIQLFVAKWTRYPQSIEELEQFNGKRYLRKRYKDPMTGKDEWRLIRINGAGQLVDSLVQPAGEKKEQASASNFITEAPAMSPTNTGQPTATNLGLRRRASEQMPNADGSMPINSQQQDPSAQPSSPPGPAQLGQSANPQAATPVLPNNPLNNPGLNAQQAALNQNAQAASDPNAANNPGNVPASVPGMQQGQNQNQNQNVPGQPVQPGQQQGQPVAVNPIYPNGTPGFPGAQQGQIQQGQTQQGQSPQAQAANNPALAALQAQLAAQQMGGQQMPGQQMPGQQMPGQQMPGQQMPIQQQPFPVAGQTTPQGGQMPSGLTGTAAQPNAAPATQVGLAPPPGLPPPPGYPQQTPTQQMPVQQFPGQQQQQFPGQQQQFPTQQPQFPAQQPQFPAQQPQQQYPAQQQMQQYPAQQPQQQYPTQQYPGQRAQLPAPQQQQQYPGQQQQFPVQPGMGYPTTTATQQGRPGATAGAAPVGTPGATPNAAAQLIMNQLTQPRPMPGNVPGAPGLTVGGGIAGVASTLESESIKLFNERQKYNEWEFVYDMKKDKRLMGAMQGGQQNPQGNPIGGPLVPSTNTNPMNPNTNPMNPGLNNPPSNQPPPGQMPFPGNQQPRFPGPGAQPPGFPAPGRR
jgi:hypothetical protein